MSAMPTGSTKRYDRRLAGPRLRLDAAELLVEELVERGRDAIDWKRVHERLGVERARRRVIGGPHARVDAIEADDRFAEGRGDVHDTRIWRENDIGRRHSGDDLTQGLRRVVRARFAGNARYAVRLARDAAYQNN